MKFQLVALAALTAIGSCSVVAVKRSPNPYNEAISLNVLFAGRMAKRSEPQCDPTGNGGGCPQSACTNGGTAKCANGECGGCYDVPGCNGTSDCPADLCNTGAEALCDSGSGGTKTCSCKYTNGGAACGSDMNYIDQYGRTCCAYTQEALEAKAPCA